MKFNPGDFLANDKGNYHLFIEEINKTSYHVWHCWTPYENDKLISYSKNASHDCWSRFNSIENSGDNFKKIAYLPGLIGKKGLIIKK